MSVCSVLRTPGQRLGDQIKRRSRGDEHCAYACDNRDVWKNPQLFNSLQRGVVLPVRSGAHSVGRQRQTCLPTTRDAKQKTMSDALQSSPTNEVIPSDVLGIIFEEHGKLEWRAPAIDGQVCRFWRQTVIGHPRAWCYIEIGNRVHPTTSDVQLWLSRSRAAPLYIDFKDHYLDKLAGLLRDHTIRIKSLRMSWAPYSLARQAFPQLEDLDVRRWSSSDQRMTPGSPWTWGPMPNLRNLRIYCVNLSTESMNGLPPLQALSACSSSCTSLIQNSYKTLTRLMLDDLIFGESGSGVIDFPSLTYLSLFEVRNLKHRMAPLSLRTYHEGGSTTGGSFPIVLPSVVEYGVYDHPENFPEPTEMDRVFPNLLRLSVRADSSSLPSILKSILDEPNCLPMLEIIAMGSFSKASPVSDTGLEEMEQLISTRRTGNNTNIALHIEKEGSFHVPLFFGEVRCCLSRK
jgi:hypothetical protein